jgi:large subunit ribosomal protein L24
MKRPPAKTPKGTISHRKSPKERLKEKAKTLIHKKVFAKGDILYVISGPAKGRYGRMKDYNTQKQTVTVEGVNMGIKHQKPSEAQPGARAEVERPIHISNVMLGCPHCNRPTRAAHRIAATRRDDAPRGSEGSKKVILRYCRHCKKDIDKVKS